MKRKLLSILAILMMAITANAQTLTLMLGDDLEDENPESNFWRDYMQGDVSIAEGTYVQINIRTWHSDVMNIYMNDEVVYTKPSGSLYKDDVYHFTAGKNCKILGGYQNMFIWEINPNVYITQDASVAVTGVTLSQTSASLIAGGAALELTPTVAPEGATDKTVKWSVTQTGNFVALYTDVACTQAIGTDAIAAAKVYVKPLAEGQATVTVTTNDGAKTANCAVTVAEPAPAGTSLTPDATRKVWTLDAMLPGNVELQVAYFPGMLTLAQAEGGSIAVDGLSLGGPKAFDVPAAWSEDNTLFSANDLPADFAAIDDADLPATISALSSDAVAFLIYGFDGEKTKVVSYVNGTKDDTDAAFVKRYDVTSWIEGGFKIYYATGATVIPAGFDTDGTNIYVEPKTQFQVKAVPATGYHLVSLSDGTNTYDVDADGIATVTMPEGDADLTLTATFSDEFELTFDDVNFKTNQNITVKVGDADKTLDQDGKLSVKAGQTVTLTAKQGYKFRSVEAKKAGAAGPVTLAEATVGMLVGSDGMAYPADYERPTGVFARAIVAYKDGTHGLAIGLMDQGGSGIENNWNTAKSECEGNTAITGATWRMPSEDDWKAMFTANGGNTNSYAGLSTLITTAGGKALSGTYWSSTGEPGNENNRARVIEADGWSESYKSATNLARAVLAW